MIFSHLPLWGIAIALVVLFTVKYFLIGAIEKTAYYRERTKGHGWMGAINTISGLNGLVTVGLFLIPAGLWWAIALGVVDFAIHWLVGYWKIKKRWPTVSKDNWTTLSKWALAIHSTSYVAMIAGVLKFLAPSHMGS